MFCGPITDGGDQPDLRMAREHGVARYRRPAPSSIRILPLGPFGRQVSEANNAHAVQRRHMTAVITAVRLERRSKGLNDLRCWHVRYRFCGVSAEITVYAHDETEARAKAVNQLCKRGLKIA